MKKTFELVDLSFHKNLPETEMKNNNFFSKNTYEIISDCDDSHDISHSNKLFKKRIMKQLHINLNNLSTFANKCKTDEIYFHSNKKNDLEGIEKYLENYIYSTKKLQIINNANMK